MKNNNFDLLFFFAYKIEYLIYLLVQVLYIFIKIMPSSSKNEETSKKYQKKTPIEHILDKPGMYIGPIDMVTEDMYIATSNHSIQKKTIQYIPGLERIFEEILLNAFDQTVREGTQTNEIHVNIQQETNTISIYNNGNGIPILYKEEFGCYIPEMLFGQLLTSSNYDDTEKRITGGTNGLGSKVSNLFSSWFKVETVDADNKKYFEMEWSHSMSQKSEPIIKSFKNKPFTRITFRPDLQRFNINGLTDDMIALMQKRVMDIGFSSNKPIKLFYNNENITMKKPEEYLALYGISSDMCMIDTSNERWTIAVAPSEDGFIQVSFVNGINTTTGGAHVQHVIQSVTKEIADKLKSKKVELKPADIKNRLCIFIKSFIENPVFDSQTKECLKMPKSKFGSEYIMDDKFKKKLVNCPMIKEMIEYSKFKSEKNLNKANGKKISRIFGIENLEEANWAGKAKSDQCRLIVTEGLSAKTFAMSGYSVIGRDRYGIFPLKGKLLNVRGIDPNKVTNNDELCKLVKILGLKFNEKYTDVKSLRYGGIVSLVDSDSVTGDTPLLIRNEYKQIMVTTIDALTSTFSSQSNGKEYGSCLYDVWTECGWTEIKHVMRHRIQKRLFRVITDRGIVDVTEDHSLLTDQCKKISPKDCIEGTTLLHDFPAWKHQHCYLNNEKTSYSIFPAEAVIMGLFFANGAIIQNRIPNKNDHFITKTTWKIGHYDLSFLRKVKKTLELFYGQVFYMYSIQIAEKKNWFVLSCHEDKHIHAYLVKKYQTLFYHTNQQKYIHHTVLNVEKLIRKNFLKGYLMGLYGQGNIQFPVQTTVYHKITAQSIFTLARSLDMNVQLDVHTSNIDFITLTITNQPSTKPSGKIIRIIELASSPNQYVYDLETRNHHFQAGIGEMIVHNTDGMHIHGLLINFFHYFWPELLEMQYVKMCLTPIVKVSKGPSIKEFYNLNEYEKWNRETKDASRWNVKYYKGLGTSNAQEAKQALTHIDQKLLHFTKDEETDTSINLGFNKKLTDERKEWLRSTYDASLNMDRSTNYVPVSEFIHKELIHFSHYDNQRSIPNMLDGFKPTQRKIIFSALKYLQHGEMKVAQFGAKVAEKTDYHHGEMSIMNTIINMAQNYMGSNNIHLLEPNGGFGTRLNNNDAASPRYIHTSLSSMAKLIFLPQDNILLKSNISDNKPVEPEWFMPCIPMILVNGSEGIGTGFSTEILKYNVDDLCTYLICKMENKPFKKLLLPWYRGFKGTIQRIMENKYVTYGVYTLDPTHRVLHITELPVGTWTDTFKKMIETKWQTEEGIIDVQNDSDDVRIDFKIKCSPTYFDHLQQISKVKLINEFHLLSKLSETNMYLFDRHHRIKKYHSVIDILDEYYVIRLEFYEKRKANILRILEHEVLELYNKMRFIKFIRESKINILKISNVALIQDLITQKFDKIPQEDDTFKYLIDMPIRQLTDEYAKKLNAQHTEKKKEYERVVAMHIKDMWKDDLKKIIQENQKINQTLCRT